MVYDPRGDMSNLMGYDKNYKPVTGTGGDPRVGWTMASAQHDALVAGAARTQEEANALFEQQKLDPRASRREYKKGGPVFR